MADTSIEWATKVWNPTTGCDRVSPGCDHCYALTMARRLKAMGQAKYQTDGDPRTSGPGFGLAVHPDTLRTPLGWRKPERIFVNSMSDLFHDGVSGEFIARVFAVMALATQHSFLILTKRHGRMRSTLNSGGFRSLVSAWADQISAGRGASVMGGPWPLPNAWLGASVENQQWADIRIPALLDTPAAVRWLSCEPLLGPVDLDQWMCSCGGRRWVDDQNWSPDQPDLWRGERWPGNGRIPCGFCNHGGWDQPDSVGPRIDWVVTGGESGPHARPSHPVIELERDGSIAAGYQAGDDRTWLMARVGKKASGRELDGRTWDEYPRAVTHA